MQCYDYRLRDPITESVSRHLWNEPPAELYTIPTIYSCMTATVWPCSGPAHRFRYSIVHHYRIRHPITESVARLPNRSAYGTIIRTPHSSSCVTAAVVALPRPRDSDYGTVHDCRIRSPINESVSRVPNALPDYRIRSPSAVERTAGGTIVPVHTIWVSV